jgi:hypothetical protein
MILTNYFLADLPPEATLAPIMVREACQTLKRNREHYLAGHSTQQLVKVLSDVAANWLQPDYPFRQLALRRGPAETGFPRATLVRGLDAFFQQVTRESLHALILGDLGHVRRLDEMSAAAEELKRQHAAMACGPELLVHITAGKIPSPTLMSMLLGLLVRSAQFVKCACGTSLIPRLFAHSIHDAEPKLASCLEIAEWRGGETALAEPLFDEADCVTVTGSDEAIAEVRCHLPPRVRLLGYGHQVSFGYVTGESLSGYGAKKVVACAADDVVAWNQLGCLAPHLFYVETGGGIQAAQFAELLGEELARREEIEPRGELPVADAATIASKRDFYRVRAAALSETRLWCSEDSTAWTVVFEADPRFQLSCLNRFVYVKAVANLTDALHHADEVRGRVSTVGVAAHSDTARELATRLARWGVTRVCPLGQMQNPPLTWRHDGRPALGDLVAWTDWSNE